MFIRAIAYQHRAIVYPLSRKRAACSWYKVSHDKPCIRCSATALYFSQSKSNGTELATYEAKHRYFPIPSRFSESMELFPLQTSIRGEITPFPHSTSPSDCCFKFKTKQSEHSKRGPSRTVVNSGPKRQ
jgi:hypothetical protein